LYVVNAMPNELKQDAVLTRCGNFLFQLHKLTVGETKAHEYDEDDNEDVCPLTTPAFHFCFALLRAAITRALSTPSKSKTPVDDGDEEKSSPVLKGLAVINEHAMLRGNADEEDDQVSFGVLLK